MIRGKSGGEMKEKGLLATTLEVLGPAVLVKERLSFCLFLLLLDWCSFAVFAAAIMPCCHGQH